MRAIKTATLLFCTLLPSFLRLAVWRMLGFKVGRGSYVAMFSIVVADKIELGPGAVIETVSLIYRPELFSMGERSRIGSFVRIIGYRGRVVLGPQTFMALGCIVDTTGDFTLGARSQIGPRSILYSHGANGLLYNRSYPYRVGHISIGADSWLGMGCIVHPKLTIGDRVIVFPGMVIRGDVPNDTALVPPATEHRMVHVSTLLIGVTNEVRQGKIEKMFSQFAATNPRAIVDQSDTRVWQLQRSDAKCLYLIRDRSLRMANAQMPAHAVIWTLFQEGVVPGVPSFCFDKLTVIGPWSRFAEEVATFLCREGGAQFVFQVSEKENSEIIANEAR
jgi:acetyltransferase-like isoleucine patch superfamily enzyme